MRKKNIYALQFYLNESGTPCLQEKWGTYSDEEIEEKFHEVQLHVMAEGFIEQKPLPHFRKIFFRFIEAVVKERCKAKEQSGE